MAYGEIKVDTITFTDGGIDKSVTISGLVQNPTFSGNITVTGTISGNTVRGQTVSGVTVTGTTAQFTSGTFTTITGGVATITSGVFAAGSAASPSISFTSDPNTGIYSPGADQVAISTGGSGRLFINSDGTISVGAVVTGNGGVVVFNASGQTTANLSTSINNGSFIVARHNDANGGAGGAFVVGAQGGSFAAIKGLLTDGSNNTAGDLAFSTRATSAASTLSERLRITSAGLVGIGTSAPSVLLHSVVSFAGVAYRGGHNNTGFDVYVDDSTGEARLVAKRTGGSGGKFMSFYTDTGSGEFERARIDSSGRVGIGTSSPLGNLHIVSSTSTAGWQVRVNGVGLSNESGFYRTASDNYEMVLRNAAGGLSYLTNTGGASSSTLEFVVQGSERARIDSSGRVGIGTSSPSATTKMSIVDSTSAGIYLLRTAEGETVIENTGPLTIRQSSGNGANQNIFFKTGASVGTEVTAMTIDGSQRVGIGTTSPATTLDVSGNQRFSAASPVLEFNNGGPQIFLPGANTLAFATGGGIGTPTERARIDSSGRLLVGTSSSRGNWANQTGVDPLLQLERPGDMRASMTRTDANQFGPQFWFGKTRGAAYQVVSSGDELGEISFMGADGSELVSAASITAAVDATPGANDMPGRLVFSTTADGASIPTERMRITNGGSLLTFNSTNDSHEIRTALAAGTTNNLILGAYGATNNTGGGTAAIAVRTNGNIENANNSYAAFSDAKLKENIVDATSQWNDVKALQVRKYNFKEGQTHTQIGLVAQEVELVSPGLVTESPDRDAEGNDLGTVTKSVNYSVLYMKAVKALQEAMERIEQLETSNADLLARVTALETA